MNGQLFEGLVKLRKVFISNNFCIDEDFPSSLEIASLPQVASEKCGFEETFNNSCECGKTIKTEGRIMNGRYSNRGQWPFMAALFYRRNDIFFCGGSLISARHVLTGETDKVV